MKIKHLPHLWTVAGGLTRYNWNASWADLCFYYIMNLVV